MPRLSHIVVSELKISRQGKSNSARSVANCRMAEMRTGAKVTRLKRNQENNGESCMRAPLGITARNPAKIERVAFIKASANIGKNPRWLILLRWSSMCHRNPVERSNPHRRRYPVAVLFGFRRRASIFSERNRRSRNDVTKSLCLCVHFDGSSRCARRLQEARIPPDKATGHRHVIRD